MVKLIVYQVKTNSPLFFLQVKNWVKELRKMLGNEICLCIVGKSFLTFDLDELETSLLINGIFQMLL